MPHRPKSRFAGHLLLFIVLWLVPPARAHDPGLSGLKLVWGKSRLTVSFTTHGKKLGGPPFAAAVASRLALRLDGKPFSSSSPTISYDHPNDTVLWQATHASPVSSIEVLQRPYSEDPASRLAITVHRPEAPPEEILLDKSRPNVLITRTAAPAGAGTVFFRFLQQGIFHIFTGPDHICFIIGLILLGGTLTQLLKTVTAFTLAHSVTLAFAATGTLTPSPRWVEPLIALSIVAVATENFRTRPDSSRPDRGPYIAFAFGLIHGFGFAGALTEIGLPRETLWPALAAFNLGIELGQATIVLAIAPLLAMVQRRSPTNHRLLVLLASSAIAAAGLVWFASRILHQ